jgi:periplasmic protein TonB
MPPASRRSEQQDWFSAAEVAHAAGVPTRDVVELLRQNGLIAGRSASIARDDAVRLVRRLRPRAHDAIPSSDPKRVTLLPDKRRRSAVSLVASGGLHAALVLGFIFITSLGWLNANDTEQAILHPQPVHLVFLMTPGPGGGGGGGGARMPDPPARAERAAPIKFVKRVSSPVPPVRRTPPPPRPVIADPPKHVDPPKVEPPKIEPPKIDPPKVETAPVEPPKVSPPTQSVQAPVLPAPADASDKAGLLNRSPQPAASSGPGTGGGIGTGAGPGLGEGRGSGIGAGSDGGTGGGPFKPGAGIEPPTLLREVKPAYTDEARRRSIEGNVQLEIVVRRDGSVANLRVLRSLGAGLDQKAMDAVRQWRFTPARRQGVPVDVVVEVSVEFSLR